jgi:hypothetical protein
MIIYLEKLELRCQVPAACNRLLRLVVRDARGCSGHSGIEASGLLEVGLSYRLAGVRGSSFGPAKK